MNARDSFVDRASRRSRSMWLLAAAVDAHGGDGGLAPVLTPGGGTKSWALLHR
ncbi:hypothetical protein OG361_32815 [Streptomyces sp. NBC_00090]|uniref:hypothetical protein n=1 Tax=Streptomyces sp. NBC_00090 TaxID=2903619 RepID=UPI0032507BA7